MKLEVASPRLISLAFLLIAMALFAGFYVEEFGTQDETIRIAYNYLFFDSLLMAIIALLWKDFGKMGVEIPYRGAMFAILFLGAGAILVGLGPFLGVGGSSFMYGQGIYLVGFLLSVTPIFMPKK